MHVDDDAWQDVVAETRTRIARLNAVVDEHKLDGRFSVNVLTAGGYQVLVIDRGGRERKAVARNPDTGILFKAAPDHKGRCKISASPKSWEKAQGRSAQYIVSRLRLDDFFIVISSSGAQRCETISMRPQPAEAS